jgi:hypothetical protein
MPIVENRVLSIETGLESHAKDIQTARDEFQTARDERERRQEAFHQRFFELEHSLDEHLSRATARSKRR